MASPARMDERSAVGYAVSSAGALDAAAPDPAAATTGGAPVSALDASSGPVPRGVGGNGAPLHVNGGSEPRAAEPRVTATGANNAEVWMETERPQHTSHGANGIAERSWGVQNGGVRSEAQNDGASAPGLLASVAPAVAGAATLARSPRAGTGRTENLVPARTRTAGTFREYTSQGHASPAAAAAAVYTPAPRGLSPFPGMARGTENGSSKVEHKDVRTDSIVTGPDVAPGQSVRDGLPGGADRTTRNGLGGECERASSVAACCGNANGMTATASNSSRSTDADLTTTRTATTVTSTGTTLGASPGSADTAPYRSEYIGGAIGKNLGTGIIHAIVHASPDNRLTTTGATSRAPAPGSKPLSPPASPTNPSESLTSMMSRMSAVNAALSAAPAPVAKFSSGASNRTPTNAAREPYASVATAPGAGAAAAAATTVKAAPKARPKTTITATAVPSSDDDDPPLIAKTKALAKAAFADGRFAQALESGESAARASMENAERFSRCGMMVKEARWGTTRGWEHRAQQPPAVTAADLKAGSGAATVTQGETSPPSSSGMEQDRPKKGQWHNGAGVWKWLGIGSTGVTGGDEA